MPVRFCTLLAGFFFAANVFSQPPRPTGKILFLIFTMKRDGDIKLTSSRVVAGSLKNRKENYEGEFLYEVMNSENRSAARGAFHSPLVRHVDWLDPDDPTRMKGGVVVDTTAQFVVRVPFESNLSAISFFTNSDADAAGLGKSVQHAAFPKGVLLKTIAIPQQETPQ